MASINKVIIVGNVGKDPEIKNGNGGNIARFQVATTDRWKDQQGQRQERTEWHSITFFGKQADFIANYVHRGSQVYVEGSLHTNRWTDQNGTERYSTGINGNTIQLLDRKQDGNQQGYQQAPQQQYQQPQQQYQQQAPQQQYQNQPQQQYQQGYQQGYQQPQFSAPQNDDVPF